MREEGQKQILKGDPLHAACLENMTVLFLKAEGY